MDQILLSLEKIPHFEYYLYAGILLFSRFTGLVLTAPVFNRKDIPYIVKIGFIFLLTMSFLPLFENTRPPSNISFFIAIGLNFIFGTLLGFIASVIFEAIVAAGDMVNMQMGLQSAMMFDPSIGSQTSIMGKFFSYLGTIIFIHVGGLFWILLAFKRGLDVFPIYSISIPLDKIVDMNYMIFLTGNVMFIGLQLSAPVVITTLCQDLILGIISKIAPQVNVFQLSFLFKPVVGTLILLIILPLLSNAIIDYFNYYSQIF